jgi:hypothetical protein
VPTNKTKVIKMFSRLIKSFFWSLSKNTDASTSSDDTTSKDSSNGNSKDTSNGDLLFDNHLDYQKHLTDLGFAEDLFLEDDKPSGNDCAICLDRITMNDPVRALACAHVFHTECILAWQTQNRQCPMCRTPVVSAPPSAPCSLSPETTEGRDLFILSLEDRYRQRAEERARKEREEQEFQTRLQRSRQYFTEYMTNRQNGRILGFTEHPTMVYQDEEHEEHEQDSFGRLAQSRAQFSEYMNNRQEEQSLEEQLEQQMYGIQNQQHFIGPVNAETSGNREHSITEVWRSYHPDGQVDQVQEIKTRVLDPNDERDRVIMELQRLLLGPGNTLATSTIQYYSN